MRVRLRCYRRGIHRVWFVSFSFLFFSFLSLFERGLGDFCANGCVCVDVLAEKIAADILGET
jgi:hypothetical protein